MCRGCMGINIGEAVSTDFGGTIPYFWGFG